MLAGLLVDCGSSFDGDCILEESDLAVRPELDCELGPGTAARQAVVKVSVSSSEKT